MQVQIVTNASAVAASFADDAAVVGPRSAAIARQYRHILAAAVVSRAPRKTGRYAASIHVTEEGVGTAAPQAHRLEVGFHGTDSLGRSYNQGPHAHFGPGADLLERPFTEALEHVI